MDLLFMNKNDWQIILFFGSPFLFNLIIREFTLSNVLLSLGGLLFIIICLWISGAIFQDLFLDCEDRGPRQRCNTCLYRYKRQGRECPSCGAK